MTAREWIGAIVGGVFAFFVFYVLLVLAFLAAPPDRCFDYASDREPTQVRCAQ